MSPDARPFGRTMGFVLGLSVVQRVFRLIVCLTIIGCLAGGYCALDSHHLRELRDLGASATHGHDYLVVKVGSSADLRTFPAASSSHIQALRRLRFANRVAIVMFPRRLAEGELDSLRDYEFDFHLGLRSVALTQDDLKTLAGNPHVLSVAFDDEKHESAFAELRRARNANP